jgi:hypothetical protein
MLFAPAMHGRGMATRAMAAAGTRAAPASWGAAEANQGQRRRQPEVIEFVDRRDLTHETPFAAASRAVLSHTLT